MPIKTNMPWIRHAKVLTLEEIRALDCEITFITPEIKGVKIRYPNTTSDAKLNELIAALYARFKGVLSVEVRDPTDGNRPFIVSLYDASTHAQLPINILESCAPEFSSYLVPYVFSDNPYLYLKDKQGSYYVHILSSNSIVYDLIKVVLTND